MYNLKEKFHLIRGVGSHWKKKVQWYVVRSQKFSFNPSENIIMYYVLFLKIKWSMIEGVV